jgi:uncharacterized membrane protein YphA (DoxX/SURF4 family)
MTMDQMRIPGEILQGILAKAALVLLRIYLGVALLVQGIELLQSSPNPDPAAAITRTGLEQGRPFLRQLLQDVVLPNAHVIGLFFTWGEVLVGSFLILGLLTRLWAAAALLLSVAYMMLDARWAPYSSAASFAAISLALLIGAAGRTSGIDSLLAVRWPRSPLW